jgi:tRNA-dihydrouridine synthase
MLKCFLIVRKLNMDFKKLVQNSLILAPLAGITDYAMRTICRELGADLAYSEMISAQALVRKNSKTLLLLFGCQEEYPSIIQLFGGEPEIMAHAAQIAVEYGADVIDINIGCSVRKLLNVELEQHSLMICLWYHPY